MSNCSTLKGMYIKATRHTPGRFIVSSFEPVVHIGDLLKFANEEYRFQPRSDFTCHWNHNSLIELAEMLEVLSCEGEHNVSIDYEEV